MNKLFLVAIPVLILFLSTPLKHASAQMAFDDPVKRQGCIKFFINAAIFETRIEAISSALGHPPPGNQTSVPTHLIETQLEKCLLGQGLKPSAQAQADKEP
jgi:hypothetical protein